MPGHPNGVQLGGLGTGRIELGSNGRLTMAGITGNPQRLLADLEGAFFHLRAGDQARVLQSEDLEECPGTPLQYQGQHPIAEVDYLLPGMPAGVHLTAFSPLIPHDLAASTLPGTIFRFRVKNRLPESLPIKLSFSWEHLLGCGGKGPRGLELECNRTGNRIEPWAQDGASGLLFTGGSETQMPNARGEMLLATRPPSGARVALMQNWNILLDRPAVLAALADGCEPERFDGGTVEKRIEAERQRKAAPPSWDDPDPRFGGGRTGLEGAVHPAGVVVVETVLAPGEEQDIEFVLSWLVSSHLTADGKNHQRWAGTQWAGVGEVAERLLQDSGTLFNRTRELSAWLRESDLPGWLVDKLINDLTPLTTNTLITGEGRLFTLEASPMMFGALGTLDQRLVSHPGTSLFFPDLNRTELDVFAELQAPDGSLPHFNGNAHTALGTDEVEYGRTGWPDLSCSYIIQCFRDWQETGETEYLQKHLPRVWKAADGLLQADQDGDGVPEGGSSWDIEHYPGCFIATATLWMATLRVLMALADEFAPEKKPVFADTFVLAEESVEKMWTGQGYYLKCLNPVDGQFSNDVFVGQLAGEWVVAQLGLAPLFTPERVREVLETLYRLPGDRQRYALMPIQTRPDGSLPERKYAWHAWPQYSMVFVDALAMYAQLREPALANLAAFDRVVREVNRTPWATTLWHDARTGKPDFGKFMGLDWYMNTPAVWWIPAALTGFGMDEPSHTLRLAPPPSEDGQKQVWPLISPRFWAQLTVRQEAAGIRLELALTRLFRGERLRIERIRWRGQVHFLPEPVELQEGQRTELLLTGSG